MVISKGTTGRTTPKPKRSRKIVKNSTARTLFLFILSMSLLNPIYYFLTSTLFTIVIFVVILIVVCYDYLQAYSWEVHIMTRL